MQPSKVIRAIALFALLCATACSQQSNESALSEILRFVPAKSTYIWFTDWSLLKQRAGVPSLTSQSSLNERIDFMLSVGKTQVPIPAFGFTSFATHASDWGWDNTDLMWEATATIDTRVVVLRFPDNFEFAPVLARFEQRRFAKTTYNGAIVYSYPGDLPREWLKSTEEEIANVGFLPEDKVLILAANPQAVRTVIDVRMNQAPALRDDASTRALVTQLGQVPVGRVLQSAEACTQFGTRSTIVGSPKFEDQAQPIRTLLASPSPLRRYTAMGIGYRFEGDQTVGLIVMNYPTAGEAQSDLEPRRLLLDQGRSLAFQRPYAEVGLSLDKALVEGTNLVLRVLSKGSVPQYLTRMMIARDMLFAVCP
jgi:hypothetical protein